MVTKESVEDVLKTIEDPEIQMDIFTLGLIYKVEIKKDIVHILMTFTFPGCPYAPMLVEEIKEKVGAISGVKGVDVDITFDPLWEPPEDLRAMIGGGL